MQNRDVYCEEYFKFIHSLSFCNDVSIQRGREGGERGRRERERERETDRQTDRQTERGEIHTYMKGFEQFFECHRSVIDTALVGFYLFLFP